MKAINSKAKGRNIKLQSLAKKSDVNIQIDQALDSPKSFEILKVMPESNIKMLKQDSFSKLLPKIPGTAKANNQ